MENSPIKRMLDRITNNTAEKEAQPFKTNDILNEILESQTPKWVNYSILVMTFIILIFTALTTYKIFF